MSDEKKSVGPDKTEAAVAKAINSASAKMGSGKGSDEGLIESLKTNASNSKKILKALKKYEDVNVDGGGSAVQTTQREVVKTSNGLAMTILRIPGLTFITWFTVLYFSTVLTWAFFAISKIPIIPPGSYIPMSWLVSIMGIGTLFLFIFGYNEAKKNFAVKEVEILAIIFFFLLLFGFFFTNTYQAQENREQTIAQAERNSFDFLKNIKCMIGGSQECVEEQLNTEQADTSDNLIYNVKFVPPVSSVKREPQYYLDKNIKVQYEIESTKDLVIEKLDCYAGSKKKDDLFYTKIINEEITTRNSGVKTWYCENFSNIDLKIQENQEITIYPILTIKLDSVITQEVPVVNYDMFTKRRGITSDDREYYELLDDFVGDYDSFKDSTGKLDVSSTFKAQLPVVIGDGEISDRSFAIHVKKGINDFGKFKSGEVLDITIPAPLKLDAEKETYLEKIEFENEIYEIDFRLEDNEDFTFNQEKIVPTFEVKFNSIFEKTGLQKIKVLMSEEEIAKRKAEEEAKENVEKQIEEAKESINYKESQIAKLGEPDSSGIYTYNADGRFSVTSSALYYKKTGDSWSWSPDNENWMSVNQETVSGGSYDGQKPTDANLEFIRSLR